MLLAIAEVVMCVLLFLNLRLKESLSNDGQQFNKNQRNQQ